MSNGTMMKKYNNSNDKKIPIKFDITMLNTIIGYVMKKTTIVSRRSLINAKQLFDIIDERIYDGDDKLYARIEFIKRVLEARIEKGFENDNMIIQYCRSEVYDEDNEEIINNLDIYSRINYEEIEFITEAIGDRLRFSYLYNRSEKIANAIDKLNNGDYQTFKEINDEIYDACTELTRDVRRTKTNLNNKTFSLEDDLFSPIMIDTVEKLKSPGRILKTGIKKLNRLLSPGYIGGRLYVYLGTSGGWKSGILLKSAKDIKMYNGGVVRKTGKRPCVLLLTMENSLEETIERLFSMSVTSEDIRKFTPQEVITMMKEQGKLEITDDNNIDIIIKYYPNQSITTDDMRTLIEEFMEEGKDTIALIVDYLKRVRPSRPAKDEKEELKHITNELSDLAKEFDIPVISAQQINRAGTAAVDAAMGDKKEDLARFLSKTHVANAWEIVENSSWVAIIQLEQKRSTGQFYLTFKRVKMRYKDLYNDDIGYFNHPFEEGNRMMLIDDIYMPKSISESSLASDFDGVDLMTLKGNRNAVKREVVDTDDSLFDFSKAL